MIGQEEDFRGTITETTYSNRITVDFPEPCITFRLREDMDKIYFITGRNKPPIQDGEHATGSALRGDLSDSIGTVFIVSSMRSNAKITDGPRLWAYKLD